MGCIFPRKDLETLTIAKMALWNTLCNFLCPEKNGWGRDSFIKVVQSRGCSALHLPETPTVKGEETGQQLRQPEAPTSPTVCPTLSGTWGKKQSGFHAAFVFPDESSG